MLAVQIDVVGFAGFETLNIYKKIQFLVKAVSAEVFAYQYDTPTAKQDVQSVCVCVHL